MPGRATRYYSVQDDRNATHAGGFDAETALSLARRLERAGTGVSRIICDYEVLLEGELLRRALADDRDQMPHAM